MPNDTINIYIDLSFLSPGDGTKEAQAEYSVEEADNIGERIIPVKYFLGPSASGEQDVLTEYFATFSGSKMDGYLNTAVASRFSPMASGVLVALTEYSRPVVSGVRTYLDSEMKYYTGQTPVSGSQYARVDSVIGNQFTRAINILQQYWTFGSDPESISYEVLYTAGNDYDPTDPLDKVVTSGSTDHQVKFELNALVSGAQSPYMEITFAGYPMNFRPDDFNYKADIIAGLEAAELASQLEATTISGTVLAIDLIAAAGTATSGSVDFDAHSCLIDLVSYSYDVETISGTIGYNDVDVYCGVSGTQGFSFDVALLSLKISNFSLAEGEYANATGTICVDVTDDMYNVATSGTYFIIDGTVASGVFTPITDGYRMCYDPVDDFASILGPTTFTVRAENDNGDILTRDYYLTSGYIVEYDNKTQDYGYDSQVVVRMSAENFANCPLTGTDAYWFTTVPRVISDLGASIVGVPLGEKDLSASITPQTGLIYFYGKTFRVEIRAKDFAGNEMAPYIFEFRIEDKPE